MAAIFPLDDYRDGWYPGYSPDLIQAPVVVDGFRPFAADDVGDFWFLDFHWPRGLTPLGAFLWTADGYCWGTQRAAESLPLPTGRGVTARFAGTHLYAAPLSDVDAAETADRFRRLHQSLADFLPRFAQTWEGALGGLEASWAGFRGLDYAAATASELLDLLHRAREYHKRAMEIHFDVMYPLVVNFLGFQGLCVELGIDPARCATFLQGNETKIMETDRALTRLATDARRAGLAGLFTAHDADRLRAALSAHGGAAARWLTAFDDFLRVYGYRTEGCTDVALPSWVEDPSPPLEMIRSLLRQPTEHDFAGAAARVTTERDEAIDAARSGLTREEQAAFDAGLAANQAANFTWWQDDHNYYIDLKVMLPLRWICLELARRVAADAADDLLFLFWPELLAVASGDTAYDRLRAVVADRRQYFAHWRDRRASMPKLLGTVPDEVPDPLLIEIFGLNPQSIKAVADPVVDDAVLAGVAAAPGVATGRARVLFSADDLPRLDPGTVLVCESTSPNWTPAFGKIAAAVCDGGGMLSHAAIVGREYGVPTVTAVGVATVAIRDGDLVEVDGTRGRVTVLSRRGTPRRPRPATGSALT